VPALAVQLRMNPKSLPGLAVVGPAAGRVAGRLAGWVGVGVADALRAEGAACLAARLERGHGPAAALLARAGFRAGGGPAGTGRGWSYL
jgi:hypothetical protein